jgi:serine/threonine protein kinase/WD40 repeat protein
VSPTHRTIETIFDEAFSRPALERSAYLDGACGGDADLRDRVEALLSAADDAGEFLEQPATASAEPVRADEGPGTVIGRYKLLQKVGEGGFGTVYMAEQERPVRRRVALKIIKLGMDTRQVIARFEAERQALALMDHPNIARVLDAGATEAGRPYFVMELVRGDPITDYCDRNNLQTAERLSLLKQVCHAIQHAHQKGVIHRDVKPSNILVTVADGRPIPKVIDFGIAKAISARLTERTLFTEHRQLIGTPEYMSPEQAEMSGVDVDTRTDVYSLGVLLYELLTGTTPFDRRTLRRAAFGEVQRIIREQDPPRPSTRLSSLMGDVSVRDIAHHRGTDPSSLTRTVRGDLDWIVMKCLEKDRTRRYETANGLANELQRYLDHVPVQAGPPSARYRLRKFARRNRTLATAVLIIAVTLLGATVLSATFGVLAGRARDVAEQAERELTASLGISERLRDEAVEARELVDEQNADLRRVAYASHIRSIEQKLAAGAQHPAQIEHLDKMDEGHRGFEWTWLRNRVSVAPTLELELDPRSPVRAAKFSPDGSRVLVATASGVARICLAATLETLVELPTEELQIREGCFDPAGARVLLATSNGLVLFDAFNGRRLADAPLDAVSVDYAPDGKRIAAAAADGTITWLDAGDLSEVARTATEARAVKRLEIGPEGRRLLLASGDRKARIVDAEDGTVLVELAHHPEGLSHADWSGDVVNAAVFSHDGRLVATAGQGGDVITWNARTGDQLRRFQPHQQFFNTTWIALDVAFDASGTLLASCGRDGLLRVHDVARGHVKGVFRLDPSSYSRLRRVEFDPTGTRLLTGDSGGFVRVWDLGTLGMPVEMVGHRHLSREVRASRDGSHAWSVGNDGTLRKWELATGRQVYSVQTHGGTLGEVLSLDLSSDESLVVVGGLDGTGRVVDAATGAVLRSFEIPPGSGALAFYRTEEGAIARSPSKGMMCVRVSPVDRLIAVGVGAWSSWVREDRPVAIHLFELATGRMVDTLKGHHGRVWGIAFAADGSMMATIGEGGSLLLWDVASRRVVHTLHERPPGGIASGTNVLIDDDRRLVLSGWQGGVIRAFDMDSGELEWKLRAHSGMISSLDLSPDGSRLLTAPFLRYEGATLWHLGGTDERPRLIALGADLSTISCAVFAGNGRILVADSTPNGVLRCYEASPAVEAYAGRRAVWERQVEQRRLEMAAQELVDDRHDEVPFIAEVIEQLRGDDSLDGALRAEALKIAAGTRDDAWDIGLAAWAIVERPGAEPVDYERALMLAQASVDLAVAGTWEYVGNLNTLGFALYRTGDYAGAREMLHESLRLAAIDARTPDCAPEDTVGLAMVYFRLGDVARAREYLERTRAILAAGVPDYPIEAIASAVRLLNEAEQLIGGSEDAAGRE